MQGAGAARYLGSRVEDSEGRVSAKTPEDRVDSVRGFRPDLRCPDCPLRIPGYLRRPISPRVISARSTRNEEAHSRTRLRTVARRTGILMTNRSRTPDIVLRFFARRLVIPH